MIWAVSAKMEKKYNLKINDTVQKKIAAYANVVYRSPLDLCMRTKITINTKIPS